MGVLLELWRREPGDRPFFIALTQGSLATGAAYAAVMLVAYEGVGSAWAAAAVLLAEIAPGMLLGPLIGAWLDRRDRLRSAIFGEAAPPLAPGRMIVVPGAAGLLALALVAGASLSVSRPAAF